MTLILVKQRKLLFLNFPFYLWNKTGQSNIKFRKVNEIVIKKIKRN